MRIPPLRLTVRRLMVAVAISGSACGSIQAWRRWATCRDLAEDHGGWRDHFDHLAVCPGCLKSEGVAGDLAISRSRALAEYHASLAGKYERAARRPWLPIEPDPPAPE